MTRKPCKRRRKGREALPKCSWQLWDEPGDTSPQIIVTDPDGNWNYLLDPETYWSKRRQRCQRSERLQNENCRNTQEAQTSMAPFPTQTPSVDITISLGSSFTPDEAQFKSSRRLKRRMVSKWKKRGPPRHGDGMAPLSNGTSGREYAKGAKGIAFYKSFDFLRTMRSMAWSW